FERILVVVLENQDYSAVMDDTYMGTVLPSKGLLMTSYRGITHPSQPNYISLIGGATLGVWNDNNFDLSSSSIVDLFEAGGVSWKSYQESYPGGCLKGDSADGLYHRKHNPFISFKTVQNDASLCAKIVNADELAQDAQTGSLPQFSFYTPNMNNDGHDTSLAFASNWLQGFLEPKLTDPAYASTVFFITWDENSGVIPGIGSRQVWGLLAGQPIASVAGTKDDNHYNHYSLLRTVELNWNLQSVG
ncbi:phosphoesterase, partial [Blyttiomyces helicus]